MCQPHCVPFQCFSIPLCPDPIVSQLHCVPVPLHQFILFQSHCVQIQMCFSPIESLYIGLIVSKYHYVSTYDPSPIAFRFQRALVPVCVPVSVCTSSIGFRFQRAPVPVCTSSMAFRFQCAPSPSVYQSHFIPIPACPSAAMCQSRRVPFPWDWDSS